MRKFLAALQISKNIFLLNLVLFTYFGFCPCCVKHASLVLSRYSLTKGRLDLVKLLLLVCPISTAMKLYDVNTMTLRCHINTCRYLITFSPGCDVICSKTCNVNSSDSVYRIIFIKNCSC